MNRANIEKRIEAAEKELKEAKELPNRSKHIRIDKINGFALESNGEGVVNSNPVYSSKGTIYVHHSYRAEVHGQYIKIFKK